MDEIRRNENTVSLTEIVFDGQAEQGVELDYVLPDYYPEIFKILKCRLTPKILSYGLSGGSKLTLDGCVDIRVMYLSDGDSAVQCIEQHYTYSKTVDIGRNITDGESCCVKLTAKPDYCNCRAVSGRRIDVRGAVSTKIQITSNKTCEIPSLPNSVQVKNKDIVCCAKALCTEKQFSVREDIETGSAGIASIIRCTAVPKVSEVRLIADKAVIKGVISVNAAYGLYNSDGSGCKEFETMTADIPVSQIIDIDGVNDTYSCNAELNILSCELNSSTDSGIISCGIQAVCRVNCRQEGSVSVPCDVFSTECLCEHTTKQIKTVKSCIPVEKQLSVKSTAACDNGELEAVWDCSSDIYNLTCTANSDGILALSGQICYQVLGRNSEGVPCFIEKQESFELEVPASGTNENCSVSFTAVCSDTEYTIRTDGSLELNAKIDFNASVCEMAVVEMIDEVSVFEDNSISHDSTYALRIYYADGTEDCWSIAKRYGASVDAIMTENEIENRDTPLSGMVLIPIA